MEQKSIALIIVALVVGVAAGAGIGMVAFGDDQNDDETYHYFLYFGEADENNGWYSATGSDAAVAFEKAMEKAGFSFTISYGYVSTINDSSMSYCAQYLYKNTDADAAAASVVYDSWNKVHNGWANIAGYDVDGVENKLSEIGSTIFFISYYGPAPDYAAICPWTEAAYAEWSVSGPFAA